ncbi:MAG: hypothetical protein [Siphoviridae sp. ctdc_1]|nr:MAG: hypothetical protein [Siphoviridae sp. ctdc_1]
MEELPELRYGGEMVRPERDSYSYTPPWGVTKSNIAGTLSRLGRSSYGGPAMVSCAVLLGNPARLQWWDDFYNYTIAEGSKRFLMELFVNGIIQPHVVQIVATPKVNTIGWHGGVDLTLEAVPVVDRCAAMSRQVMMPCYGDKTAYMVGQIIEVGVILNGVWNEG